MCKLASFRNSLQSFKKYLDALGATKSFNDGSFLFSPWKKTLQSVANQMTPKGEQVIPRGTLRTLTHSDVPFTADNFSKGINFYPADKMYSNCYCWINVIRTFNN